MSHGNELKRAHLSSNKCESIASGTPRTSKWDPRLIPTTIYCMSQGKPSCALDDILHPQKEIYPLIL
ncbi:hypothetical protein PIB30_097921, partial [Stylosanthes scabra]|nr:hypothetical protein [Stylosanthes scabra]